MKEIQGVPQSVTRAQFISLLEPLGFDVNLVQELLITPSGIMATVLEKDEAGKQLIGPEPHEVAKSTVFIRIEG